MRNKNLSSDLHKRHASTFLSSGGRTEARDHVVRPFCWLVCLLLAPSAASASPYTEKRHASCRSWKYTPCIWRLVFSPHDCDSVARVLNSGCGCGGSRIAEKSNRKPPVRKLVVQLPERDLVSRLQDYRKSDERKNGGQVEARAHEGWMSCLCFAATSDGLRCSGFGLLAVPREHARSHQNSDTS